MRDSTATIRPVIRGKSAKNELELELDGPSTQSFRTKDLMYGDIVERGVSTSERACGRDDGEMIRGRRFAKSRILVDGIQSRQTRLQKGRDPRSHRDTTMSYSSCGKTDIWKNPGRRCGREWLAVLNAEMS